jgi:3-methyladenine DNA glycosylase AlkD
MNDILKAVRADLKKNSDAKIKVSAQNFFKEKVRFYGVKTFTTHAIAKKHWVAIKHDKKKDIFQLCEELLKTGYFEEALVACDWSYTLHRDYEASDFKIFERWVKKYINNWAACDTLCNHTIGSFIEKYPTYLAQLKIWTKSKNRWVKRAAAVTLIIPSRTGKFLPDIFEIADALLLDKDDLVQKGYGWMLKAASVAHQPEVFEYVMAKKKIMPRTALRYAIEKMPANLKKLAMQS